MGGGPFNDLSRIAFSAPEIDVVSAAVAAQRAGLYGQVVAGGSLQGEALGRSQAVRQRILIPPCGGSNPPAPASY